LPLIRHLLLQEISGCFAFKLHRSNLSRLPSIRSRTIRKSRPTPRRPSYRRRPVSTANMDRGLRRGDGFT